MFSPSQRSSVKNTFYQAPCSSWSPSAYEFTRPKRIIFPLRNFVRSVTYEYFRWRLWHQVKNFNYLWFLKMLSVCCSFSERLPDFMLYLLHSRSCMALSIMGRSFFFGGLSSCTRSRGGETLIDCAVTLMASHASYTEPMKFSGIRLDRLSPLYRDGW